MLDLLAADEEDEVEMLLCEDIIAAVSFEFIISISTLCCNSVSNLFNNLLTYLDASFLRLTIYASPCIPSILLSYK